MHREWIRALACSKITSTKIESYYMAQVSPEEIFKDLLLSLEHALEIFNFYAKSPVRVLHLRQSQDQPFTGVRVYTKKNALFMRLNGQQSVDVFSSYTRLYSNEHEKITSFAIVHDPFGMPVFQAGGSSISSDQICQYFMTLVARSHNS